MLVLLFSEIKIWVPDLDNSELPTLWWDAISDKCLLLGVFKHGKKFHILFVSSFIYLQVTEKYVVICTLFSSVFVCVCVRHNVVEDTKVTIINFYRNGI